MSDMLRCIAVGGVLFVAMCNVAVAFDYPPTGVVISSWANLVAGAGLCVLTVGIALPASQDAKGGA